MGPLPTKGRLMCREGFLCMQIRVYTSISKVSHISLVMQHNKDRKITKNVYEHLQYEHPHLRHVLFYQTRHIGNTFHSLMGSLKRI